MPTDNNQNQNQQEKNEGNNEQNNQETKPFDFESWLKEQPEEVKVKYEEHVSGLKNTVTAVRRERDDYKNQIQDALKQVEKGSLAEKSLSETLLKLEVADRKASFFEEAIKPEIGCRNPKVAFSVAVAENLFNRSGTPDWVELKKVAPELFGAIVPKGNSGSGTGDEPPKHTDMNSMIRKAAGVQ